MSTLVDRVVHLSEERAAWAALSQPALQRVWDSDENAIYDDWKTLYGVPKE